MIKRTLTIIFAITLTACGFTPVHAPLGGDKASFRNVKVVTLETTDPENKQSGFFLKQRLRDRVGSTGEKYTLELEPALSQIRLGISSADVASRYDFVLTTSYKLIDTKSGKVLTKGRVRSTSTFAAPSDAYGLESSETNATQLIASDNADRIIVKLAGYFSK